MLRLEVHETVKDVAGSYGFVFLTHMPATIRPVLASLDLQKNGLAIIKKVDQDVYL
jgi:hypothetical protein